MEMTETEPHTTRKTPKSAAQRCREYRARKRAAKVAQLDDSAPAVVKIEYSALTGRVLTANALRVRRYRERKRAGKSPKIPKTAAQRVREYRQRKKTLLKSGTSSEFIFNTAVGSGAQTIDLKNFLITLPSASLNLKDMEVKTELERSCTLCHRSLTDPSDSVSVDDGVLEILKFLMSRLDTTTLQGAPLCSSCIAKLREAYNYKTLYLENSRKPTVDKIKIKTEPDEIKNEANLVNNVNMDESPSPAFNIVLIKEEASENVRITEKPNDCCICKNVAGETTCLPLFKMLEKNNRNEVIKYLSPELGLQAAEDLVICEVCKTILPKICDTLTLLSIYEEQGQTNCDVINFENDLKVQVKQEPFESNLVSLSDNQSELMELQPGCSKQIDEYEQFQCKNEEIELKMESEDSCDGNQEEIDLPTNNSFKNKLFELVQQPDIMYKCLICRYITDFESSILNHLLTHRTFENKNQCPFCNFQTNRRPILLIHMMKFHHTDEAEWHKCDFCIFQTKWKTSFTNHLLCHKQNEIEWTKYIPNQDTDHMHENLNENRMFKCTQCSYETTNKFIIQKHMMVVHKMSNPFEMYTCPDCNFQTKLKSDLIKHLFKHKNSKIKTFTCTHCTYITKHKANLMTETVRKKPTEVEIFKCHFCNVKKKLGKNMQKT